MGNSKRILINNYLNSQDKYAYFRSKTNIEKHTILDYISDKDKIEVLEKLKDYEIIEMLKPLDPDEVTDIIYVLDKSRQKRIISSLNSTIKEKVDFLLKFAPNSPAGLMSLNYIIVPSTITKTDLIKRLEKHLEAGKKEPTILMINEIGHFLGELRISSIIFNKKTDFVNSLKKLPTIIYNENKDECIDIFQKNKHEKLVVLDGNETVLGIIHAKDVFRMIEEANTQDFYAISGVHKEEDVEDGVFTKVHFRLGWLIINLMTAFLAAFVVSLFDETISKYVLLAAFMPIIAGMGGNAGTQTSAILIRGLALKRINKKMRGKLFVREFLAATINGFLIGCIVAIIAYSFDQSLLFGIVAGTAILINLVVAAVFGTLVPIILETFGLDPAISSSVFVTTATDVFGFLAFLGLATIILM